MVSITESLHTTSTRRSHLFTSEIIAAFTGLLDVLIIVGSSLVIYWLYVGWVPEKALAYIAISVFGAASIVQLFYISDLYRPEKIANPWAQIHKIVLICTIVFMCLVTFLFALKFSAYLSRVWFFSWHLATVALLCLARVGMAALLIRQARAGHLARNVVVVGAGEQAERLVARLELANDAWIRLVGIFDDRSNSDRIGGTVCGHPVLGNLHDLVAYVRAHRCDEVIIAMPWSADSRINDMLRKLRSLPVHISLGPDLVALSCPSRKIREFAGAQVFEIRRPPLSGWHYLIKVIEDWLVGGLLFLLTFPLMLVIAILIKLDSPGPVFFRQQRFGFNHQLINVWKFRTMHADQTDVNAAVLVTRDDPRITRLGAFLRRTSLDELPQLINVLKGEMSLVGPRPHALHAKAGNELYADVVDEYAARHNVKPGITGWAQVNGWRGETDTDRKIIKRVEYDLHYIENWGLWLDIKILLRTVVACMSARNAY